MPVVMRHTTADYFPHCDVHTYAVSDCERASTMSTPAKHMLLSAISQHALYKEKQLVKSGELGACAVSIIKRLRKTVRRYHCLLIAFLVCPVIMQVLAWIFLPDRPTMWPSFLAGALCGMTQIPPLIQLHVSLCKFETVVAMWLYTNADEAEQTLSHSDMELSKLVASTF